MNETWDDSIYLIEHGETQDEIGQPVIQETRTEVYACRKAVSRSEFYHAGQMDIRPEEVFEIHSFEYDGQVMVEFMGQIYSVIRTYQKNKDLIELVCQRKAGDYYVVR